MPGRAAPAIYLTYAGCARYNPGGEEFARMAAKFLLTVAALLLLAPALRAVIADIRGRL